jgi:protein-tyrosine phosphatase
MTPDEITPGIFVGEDHDCDPFDGVAICVTDGPLWGHRCLHIPILKYGDGPAPDYVSADRKQLALVTKSINAARHVGLPVLVHCAAGIERSPLAVAWYIAHQRNIPLEAAYEIVKAKHPITQDRRYWVARR